MKKRFNNALLCALVLVWGKEFYASEKEAVALATLAFCKNATEFSYDTAINLGGDCQVAYQLKLKGLRYCSLPFDVLVTPYESLEKILKEKFEGFLDRENFEFVENEKGEKYILDKKYGARFFHDFRKDPGFLDDYDKIVEKYKRRIERFKNLVVTAKNPLFIRKRITKEETTRLKELLTNIRSSKPFSLLVVDGSEEIKEEWSIEGVSNYFLKQPEPYSWKGDSNAWSQIFQAVGLKASEIKDQAVASPSFF